MKLFFKFVSSLHLFNVCSCGWYGTAIPKFFWVEDDPLFDCVTPIAYKSEPISLGVLIQSDIIVTAFNPMYQYLGYMRYYFAHIPNGDWSKSQEFECNGMIADKTSANYFWIYWGASKTNPPLHDLMFLRIPKKVGASYNSTHRKPYFIPIAKKYAIEEPSGWSTAAFALIDRQHVRQSTRLIPVYYDEPVLVDCDEWFPRFWGYFICILNIDNYPVIQSGAPLIQNNRLFGIASFSLRKGKESLFVFTDLRPYRKIIYGLRKRFYSK